jgi:hypothetical protein
VEENSEWGGVGGKDDKLAVPKSVLSRIGNSPCCDLPDTSVQRLGSLVGTLLQLAVVSCLLDKVKYFLRKSLVYRTVSICWSIFAHEALTGLGPCCAVVFGHFGLW